MTDGELVRRALDGERRALEQLARCWAGRVLAVCHARVPRRDVAEDLAQETLLRGLQQLPTLKSPESFGPWLRGIAAHVCQDWLRSRPAHELALSSQTGNGDLHPARRPAERSTLDVETADEQVRLLDHVHALPEELREVVLLYYYDEMTYDELATVIGVSKATVNARLAKARETLRRQLSRSAR
ncbi:MAG: sigma-70 family RNA polymerase sigma factor [Planctomycetaceae bacterium]